MQQFNNFKDMFSIFGTPEGIQNFWQGYNRQGMTNTEVNEFFKKMGEFLTTVNNKIIKDMQELADQISTTANGTTSRSMEIIKEMSTTKPDEMASKQHELWQMMMEGTIQATKVWLTRTTETTNSILDTLSTHIHSLDHFNMNKQNKPDKEKN